MLVSYKRRGTHFGGRSLDVFANPCCAFGRLGARAGSRGGQGGDGAALEPPVPSERRLGGLLSQDVPGDASQSNPGQMSAGLLLGNRSLELNCLVENKLGFPLNPQTVELFAGGSTATKNETTWHKVGVFYFHKMDQRGCVFR